METFVFFFSHIAGRIRKSAPNICRRRIESGAICGKKKVKVGNRQTLIKINNFFFFKCQRPSEWFLK